MLANLDKDCTTKQLITSLRNFYPILNEYYLFEFNDDEDFEVMVTITSIIQNNNAATKTSSPVTTKTSSPVSNKTIIDNDKRTTLLTVTTIVDKTSVKHNNDVSVNTDLPSTPDIVQEFEHFDANSDNDTTPTVDRVIESPILTIINDDDDDNSPTEPEFQDFDALPVQKATKASWFTVPTRGRTSTLSTTTHSTSRFSVKKNIYDNLREEETNEKSTILNNSSNDDVLGQDDRITSSIVRASNKVNFDVAKIVANSSPLLSNDTINDFLTPQEARHDDTPLRSNTVVNTKNTPVIPLDEIESDNESSVGMPHLLTRHDDNSSTDSDESHYFQDDKANIAEWLEADDDDSVSKAHHSVSFKTDDQKIVDKSNNVQDTLIAHSLLPSTNNNNNNSVNSIRHHTVDKTTRPSDIVITFSTLTGVDHNTTSNIDNVATTTDDEDHNKHNVAIITENTVDNSNRSSKILITDKTSQDVDHNNISIVDDVVTTKDALIRTPTNYNNNNSDDETIIKTNTRIEQVNATNNNPNVNKVNEEDNTSTSECYNKTSSNSNKIINTKYISTAQDTQSKYISHHHGQPNDVNHLKTDLTNEARIINNNNVNNDKSNLLQGY